MTAKRRLTAAGNGKKARARTKAQEAGSKGEVNGVSKDSHGREVSHNSGSSDR